MEISMSSRPITYRSDFETPPSRRFVASIARKLAAFARASSAYGIGRGIEVLESRARRRAEAVVGP